ncbi:MAG: ATP-dependent metalloprotease, partial [Pseudomonadales bacterium]|nr:ATP-dependent metalloprotease [Pseudomonadales bacterium]
DKLHNMANALVLYQTLDSDQINDIMEGKAPRPPSDWDEGAPGASGMTDDKSDSKDNADEAKLKGSPGKPASEH